MTVRLKRSTSTVGGFIKYKVRVNGEKTAKITQGETKDIELTKENSVIQIKQLNGKSNTLTVNDGDTVEISNGPFVFFGFILGLILVPIATSLTGLTRWSSLFIVFIIYLITLQLFDSFKLKKLNGTSTLTK
ncbi:hypothetical protein [Alkalibacterium kapii]|uniref:Uncharacterized protein n=1 Tax=Alkalibacterium kapii TaxID=426704 RepID=A0A511ASD7_9LACT|nr:hypothetical protein [Alkalibacterium kapii]GEK91114.1 hypothetical protein AKA01nite_07360 [Alkalibacterium kapii]